MEVTRERLQELLNKQQGKTVTVLSSLILIQNHLGYLPPEAMPAVAELTGASTNDVYGVATFYTHFRLSPPPPHAVEVCWGPSCHLRGAPAVLRAMERAVDGNGHRGLAEVAIRRNSCLGACAHGPVASVDEELVGRLTPDKIAELLARLRSPKP